MDVWQLHVFRGVLGGRILETGTKARVRVAAQAYLDRHQLREIRTYWDGDQYEEVIEACYAPSPPRDQPELLARLALLEEERAAAQAREERLTMQVLALEARFAALGSGVRTIGVALGIFPQA